MDAAGCVDAGLFRAIQETLASRAGIVTGRSGSNRLLHGDFDAGQLVADTSNGRITGFFDFDDVASGDPAWDLASLAHRDGDEWLRGVLEGYEPDASLTQSLHDGLPLYRLMHDVVAVRVAHERGWHEQLDQATSRLRDACE